MQTKLILYSLCKIKNKKSGHTKTIDAFNHNNFENDSP